MTTRICPFDKTFYEEMVNTPPNKNDFKINENIKKALEEPQVGVPSIYKVMELFTALQALNNGIAFLAYHQEFKYILEPPTNTDSLPENVRPVFNALIGSIQKNLHKLETKWPVV